MEGIRKERGSVEDRERSRDGGVALQIRGLDGRIVDEAGGGPIVPWWSLTKTAIAAAALTLVRDRRLGLDDPYPGQPYRLRHLLQHRAGLPNYGILPDYHAAVKRRDSPWPAERMLEAAGAGTLGCLPGQGWRYSNIGYLFARQMVETADGRPLDAILKARVFGPLGLAATRVAETLEDLRGVAMGTAADYHPAWVYHGLVVGPLTEAALFVDRLFKGGLFGPPLLTAMLHPHPVPMTPRDGRPWREAGYGLGVMIGTVEGGIGVAGHTGGGPGSTIAVYRRQEAGPGRTGAAFAWDEHPAAVEARALALCSEPF